MMRSVGGKAPLGAGKGKVGAKRHRKILKDTIQGISESYH